MSAARRYHRVLIVVVSTAVLFLWCWSAAATDNDRWVQDLHAGHQSERFQAALQALNAREGALRVDECSVCHQSEGWLANLVQPLPAVQDARCRQCHEPGAPEGDGDSPPTLAAMPRLGTRLARPAHQGIDLPEKHAGMGGTGATRLDCAACHPDHEGRDSVQRVKMDEQMRVRMTRECAGCHLPREPGAEATDVLQSFARAHQGNNGFEPALPETALKAVLDAPAGRPIEAKAQTAFVDAVLETVRRQEFFGDPDESRRGCTPGCHGEHSPGVSDATPDDYRLPAAAR